MKKLTIDDFLYFSDFELSQYRIMDSLNNYSRQFQKMKLYPGLSELSELSIVLKDIGNDAERVRSLFNSLKGKSSLSHELSVVPPVELDQEKADRILELVDWVRPLVNEVISEGKVVYEFVKSTIQIRATGQMQQLPDKGYLVITSEDAKYVKLFLFKYSHLDALNARGEIEAVPLKTIYKEDKGPDLDMIVDEYLYKSALPAIICVSGMDFPFNETILPVTKRKLISRMAA